MRKKALRFLASPSIATWASFSARGLPLIILPGLVFSAFENELAALWFILITLQNLQLLIESNIGLTFIRAIGFGIGGAQHLGRHHGGEDVEQDKIGSSEVSANHSLLAELWAAMRYLYLGVALLSLLIFICAGIFATQPLINKIDNPSEGIASVVIFIACAALRAYGGLHISFLYGVGHIARLRWCESFFWGCSFLFALGALLLERGFILVVICYQLPLLINLIANVVLSRLVVLVDHKQHVERERIFQVLSDLWPPMWRSALGVIIYMSVIQGAGLIYARYGEPNEVALYLFAMSLMRPMMQFAQVPFFTQLPTIASLHVSGQRRDLLRLVNSSMQLSFMLLGAMIVLVGVGFPYLARYSDLMTPVPQSLWGLIGMASILERVGAMHLQLYSQTNHIIWHWANGGAAVVFGISAALLVPQFSVKALPLAMIAASVIYYVPVCRYFTYKTFSLGWKFDLKTVILPLLAVLLLNFMAFS